MTTVQYRKVVITRSHEGNLELASELKAMGLEVVSLDLLSFLPPASWTRVDSKLLRLKDFDWVLFTSSTGVQFFLVRMRELGLPLAWGSAPKVGAVGKGTAGALSAAGVRVDFKPDRYLTKALAEQLPGSGGKVLLLRADIADKAMVAYLAGRGFVVDDVAIYRTRRLKPKDIAPVLNADLIIFGSPSAVDALCARLPSGVLAKVNRMTAACIGPVTANAARKYGFREVLESPTHTFGSLLESVGRTVNHA